MYGINIIGVTKAVPGVDKKTGDRKSFKRWMIDQVQEARMSVTKSSVNIIREYRNYFFVVNKITGKATNEPEDGNDHAMDGLGYAVSSVGRKSDVRPYKPKAMLQRKYR